MKITLNVGVTADNPGFRGKSWQDSTAVPTAELPPYHEWDVVLATICEKHGVGVLIVSKVADRTLTPEENVCLNLSVQDILQ